MDIIVCNRKMSMAILLLHCVWMSILQVSETYSSHELEFANNECRRRLAHAEEWIRLQRQELVSLRNENKMMSEQIRTLIMERDEIDAFIDKLTDSLQTVRLQNSRIQNRTKNSVRSASRQSQRGKRKAVSLLNGTPDVMITNLPPKWTDFDVKSYLAEFGPILNITFQGSSSKNGGRVYVQFAFLKSAQNCVTKKDGYPLFGKVLSVSLSHLIQSKPKKTSKPLKPS